MSDQRNAKQRTSNTLTVIIRVGHESFFGLKVTGLPRGVRDNSILEVFGDHWPPYGATIVTAEDASVERHFTVDLTSPDSLTRFESDFGLYVAEKLEGYVAVHSALIRFGDVTAIFPGLSHAGKSTLTHAALEAGHQVLSDEYTLINLETGMVTGWPRPIRRRESDGSITRIPIPHDWAEYAPTLVVDVRYDPETTGLNLETLDPGDIAFSLLGNTLCAQSRPEDSLRATAAVARVVRGGRGTRGDVTEALPALEQWLQAHA